MDATRSRSVELRLAALGLLVGLSACGAAPEGDGLSVDAVDAPFAGTEEMTSSATADEDRLKGDGEAPTRACKSVVSFMTYAAPVLRERCTTCHDGTKLDATELFDLSTLEDNSPAGQQYSCDLVLSGTSANNPQASLLFLTVDPSSKLDHDFKFSTDAEFVSFRDSVMYWLGTETE